MLGVPADHCDERVECQPDGEEDFEDSNVEFCGAEPADVDYV
jgi:hypothetical protein